MRLFIGDKEHDVAPDEETTLLEALRACGMKSVVRGCKNGTCGSCRVLVDGSLVASCGVPVTSLPDGARVLTYEQLEHEPEARIAVAHFEDERNSRCRLCVAGLGVAAVHLARENALSDDGAIDRVAQGAHCQCTGRGSLRRSLAFIRQKPPFSGTSSA
ncbi:MAG: 2Fe-2S iron-sulfur cluster-binding protein [Polyangiaceae bacterium]